MMERKVKEREDSSRFHDEVLMEQRTKGSILMHAAAQLMPRTALLKISYRA